MRKQVDYDIDKVKLMKKLGTYENRTVLWYNDIEEGFNISNFNKPGTIEKYYGTEQDELQWTIAKLINT